MKIFNRQTKVLAIHKSLNEASLKKNLFLVERPGV